MYNTPIDSVKKENVNEPLISMIIPIYNGEKYLERCLYSIRNQRYRNIEAILIDDGSIDYSSKICQDFSKNDNRFHFFSQDNHGVSSARNLGLDKIKGKYLLFVDSDDYIEENYITKLWESVKLTGADMVICDYRQECEHTNAIDMIHYTAPPGDYNRKSFINQLSKCPGAHYFGVLWNKLYNTELIRSRKLSFNTALSLGEDFAFNMEYLSLVNHIKVIADRLYIYSWKNPSSLSHQTKAIEKQLEERFILYQAYKDLFCRENLEHRWWYKLHYYMLKAYFEETKALGSDIKKYQRKFYKRYISDTGIGKKEFQMFLLMKELKHLMKFNNGG